jgi:uncharacterized membrane protein required for colicin V production
MNKIAGIIGAFIMTLLAAITFVTALAKIWGSITPDMVDKITDTSMVFLIVAIIAFIFYCATESKE